MIVGTRDSRLALAQTNIFTKMIAPHSKTEINIMTIKTTGDADQTSSLKDMGGFGAFVRELDNALIRNEIDVSVNSMKDIPVQRSPEITIGAVLPRASCEDVILPVRINELPKGAVVGSSSVRRSVALRNLRPDLDIRALRGNIDTRLRKLDSGGYDAIILAKAGLERLGIVREMYVLSIDDFVPAPAQGAIAAACRSSDREMIWTLGKIDDAKARTETQAERDIMTVMGGNCSSPVGINVKRERTALRVRAMFFDGTVLRKCNKEIPINYAASDLEKIAAELRGVKR